MRLFGPYYYGQHRWDNYLLDIQDTIAKSNVAQPQDSRPRTKKLESAHEQQLGELRQQTEQMRRIEDALHGGFEELRAEFEWGFTLMADRMETQIHQLSQIAARLDAIHKTLQSPLLTQARELFQLGQEHFRKRLLDKALETYLRAEEKNEVDFPLQLQIGKLFLYGRDEDDDVIDLCKAEKHLLLAARYADAEKATFPQWNEYCGQAYFHAAVAAYLIGEREQAAGHTDSMRACLEHALGYLAKAAALWPRFTEIVYTQAKCHALLGQIGDAALKLEVLSDRDRRYFSKASQDGDFESFRDAVEELFRRATISPGPLARGALVKLNEVADAVEWAKRSAPTSEGDKAAIESARRAISDGRRSLPTLEVDIEGLCEDLDRMGQELKVISERSFQQNLKSSQEAIKSCEQRKTWCEDSIKQLERTMKSTSGAGAGWLFFIVSFVFAFFLKGSAFSPWLVITIVGTFVSNYISRDIKNRPHRLNVVENTRSIDESIRTLPLLKEKADSWTQEMRKYAAWQAEAHRPIPSNGEAAFKTAGDAV